MNLSTLFHYLRNHKIPAAEAEILPVRDGKTSVINRLQTPIGKCRMPFEILARPLQR
jgi:hypothetical protein